MLMVDDRHVKIYDQRINMDDIEKILLLKFSNICVNMKIKNIYL